jgi:hypothetical protein
VDGVKPAAIFVLRASAKVEAGQPISVEIVRQTHDGRAHDFELKFDPGTLINGAPEKAVRIGDGSEGWKADIATVVNPPGDGPQTLHIYLMPGESGPQIGVPRTVDVVVTRPATFSVRAPDTAVPRGDPVAFTIGRSGGSGQARVTYTVTQGTNLLSKGELVFEENAGPQNVRFTDYDRCAEPLTFELLGAKGQTKATAAFFGRVSTAASASLGGNPQTMVASCAIAADRLAVLARHPARDAAIIPAKDREGIHVCIAPILLPRG